MKKIFILFLLIMWGLLFVGCSSDADKGGSKDANPVDITPNDTSTKEDVEGGDDVGPTDRFIQKDYFCTERDQECPPDMICDKDKGKCVAGKTCTDNSTCAYDYPNGEYYCDSSGKVCKRRLMICEPCNSDEECGYNIEDGEDEDRCVEYLGGKKYCGKACGKTACPPGFECTTVDNPLPGPNPNQCKPKRLDQADPFSCSGTTVCTTEEDCKDPNRSKCVKYLSNSELGVCAGYCENDRDCPQGYLCRLDTHSCIASCIKNGQPFDDQCSSAKPICHYNGKCDLPCSVDTDCDTMFGKLELPRQWLCKNSRCIIQICDENNNCTPGCLSDSECCFPGYCDTTTNMCMCDMCRTEKDCWSGYKCENQQCIKLNCLENGGAVISCNIFEFCCGEDPSKSPCKDPAGEAVKDGDCYLASTPPWCTQCEKNEDCDKAKGFDGYCYEFQDKDGNTIGKFCGVPCTGKAGECPRGHECRDVKDDKGQLVSKTCMWLKCPDWIKQNQQ